MMQLFARYRGVNYSLSVNPEYPLSEEVEDNTLRSEFEGGYEHSRPRFTRNRKTFGLTYRYITNADKTTIENLFRDIRGADMFTWRHPKTNSEHIVRFVEPLKFEYVQFGYWNVNIKLRIV